MIFRQFFDGLPVEGGGIAVHLTQGKGVYDLHGNYYTDIDLGVSPSVSFTADGAIAIALMNLEELGFTGMAESRSELTVYPLAGNSFLAYKVEVSFLDVEGDFVLFVDAESGEVLLRKNRILFVDGSGDLFLHHPEHWNNPAVGHPASLHLFSQDVPLTNLTLDPQGRCILTNSNFTITNGRFTIREDNDTASAEADCTFEYPPEEDGKVYNPLSEVLAYFHMNQFRDWLIPLFDNPGDSRLAYQIPVIVNWNVANNAGYFPFGDLIRMGGGSRSDSETSHTNPVGQCFISNNIPKTCNNEDYHNSARDESVLHHEYLHSMVAHMLANPDPEDVDIANGINEGLADYFTDSFRNDSIQAVYFGDQKNPNWRIGLPPRDADHDFIYPDDAPTGDETEPHAVGHIYVGALWDFREEFVQEELTSDTPDRITLRHIYYLSQGLPETTTSQVMNTLENSLSAMLTSADNGNAKEHKNRIKATFCRHNIGLSYRSPVINGEIYYPRGQTPPTFENWFGSQDDGYKVQITTSKLLFTNPLQRNSTNWYESGIMVVPSPLLTGPSKCAAKAFFTMPQSNWDSMKQASNFFYRVISYFWLGEWVSPVYSTSNSDLDSMPVMSLNSTGMAP